MNNLIELIEYNIWANKRVLSQAKGISHDDLIKIPDGCLLSLKDALVHLIRSDWIWLGRWQGEDFMDIPEEWYRLEMTSLESIWNSVQINTIELLQSKILRESHDLIVVSNGKGQSLKIEFSKSINLVIDHGAHYRGQISNMIQVMGRQPIKTQLLNYYLKRHL